MAKAPNFNELCNVFNPNPGYPTPIVPPGPLKAADVPVAMLWPIPGAFPVFTFPVGTVLRGYDLYVIPDLIEYPPGSGDFYLLFDVLTVREGYGSAFVKAGLLQVLSHP